MNIPPGSMAVDDLANRIASFLLADVKDGVPVNGSRCNCRLSCLFDHRRPDLLAVSCIDGRIYWQSS